MSGKGRYHHMGHRNFLVGGRALEGLPKGWPELDADIGQRWGFRRQHGYHVSILALPHAQRGVTQPPPPRLTETPARMDGRDTITHPLDSVWPLSTGLIVVLPNGKERRFMPTDFRGGRTQAITTANTEAALYNPAGHRTGSTYRVPSFRLQFLPHQWPILLHPHSREPGFVCRHYSCPLRPIPSRPTP